MPVFGFGKRRIALTISLCTSCQHAQKSKGLQVHCATVTKLMPIAALRFTIRISDEVLWGHNTWPSVQPAVLLKWAFHLQLTSPNRSHWSAAVRGQQDDSALHPECRLGDGGTGVRRAGGWEMEERREGEAQTPRSPRRGPLGWVWRSWDGGIMRIHHCCSGVLCHKHTHQQAGIQ